MSNIQYSLIRNGDEAHIMLIIDGEPYTAGSENPAFAEILDLATDAALNDEDVDGEYLADLCDVERAVARQFDRLSERVTVSHGVVYFDGDPVESALTKQIERFLREGVGDWEPLVNFFEKVQQNPNDHSREQLFSWLDRHDVTIAPDGDCVFYKGVAEQDGKLLSIHAGEAIVDGTVVAGQIPNEPGSTVEMPREQVQHDPTKGCHRGLHCGTFEYASTYGSKLLEVRVNPRDVVSVPTDSNWQKVRTCRYRVVDVLDSKYDGPVLPPDVDGSDEDDDHFIVTVDIAFEVE